MAPQDPNVVFVSGHLDLTEEEFEEHYVPRLHEAVSAGRAFVVGDAPGCDFMAQRWLAGRNAKRDRLGRPPIEARVFHMLDLPRHSFGSGHGSRDPGCVASDGGGFPLVGGFASDEERDAAMTAASAADIAWVRPGRSKKHSGTAHNLQRRRQLQQQRESQERAERRERMQSWPAVHVSVVEEYPVFGFSLMDPEREALSLYDHEITRGSCARAGDPDPFHDVGTGITRSHVARLPKELVDRLHEVRAEEARLVAQARRYLSEQGFNNDY